MKLTSALRSCISVLPILTFAATPAMAAGFYLQEQSVSGLGSAFAGQGAQPRDASVIFFNPAAMTYLEGGNAHLGVHLLVPDSQMTNRGSTRGGVAVTGGDGGNPYEPTPVPNAYITKQVTNQFWIGLGVSAPFGLANEYDDGWFGRYDSTETELTTIDISPSFAFKINDRLSIGGSVIVEHVTADLKNNVFAGTEGTQSLDGDDVSAGFKVGVIAEPWTGTRLGLDYRSEMDHELEGRLRIANTGSALVNADIVGNASLVLPDMASFSVAHDLNERLTLLATATWFGWNDFERIEIRNVLGAAVGSIEQNYQSTWAFAAGFDYKLNDAWTLRAGYQFDQTPTTDEYRTSRTPDGDRHWFSAGGTYTLNDRWSFDFAGTYIDIADESVNVTRNIPAVPAQVRADTEGHVGIVALGVNYSF